MEAHEEVIESFRHSLREFGLYTRPLDWNKLFSDLKESLPLRDLGIVGPP